MTKPVLLCLLLLPACSSSYELGSSDYQLAWRCLSPEGCEYAEEVSPIDRARKHGFDFYFESTQDESFTEEALVLSSDSLGEGCFWLDEVSLFGHELEPSLTCSNPAGFEIRLSIPNTEDPATNSEWFVSAWELSLL
jgi:hypothetical protein